MPRRSSRNCYFGCPKDGPLHDFPRWNTQCNSERFDKWKSVLDIQTQEKGNNYICNSIRLCHRHFENPYKLPSRRLTPNAIPTLNLGDESVVLHKFPNPKKDCDRFFTWRHAVGGNLCTLQDDYIYKYRRICDSHFEQRYFTWNKLLTRDSVPTLGLKGLILHHFPNPEKDRERFNTWLYAIGGAILQLENQHIYKHRRVCRAHFEEKYLCRNKGLSRIAVPTLNMPGKDQVTLHCFPKYEKDPEHFRSWLYAIGGEILALDNDTIYKKVRVCHKHFETKYRTWTKMLSSNAVPTLHLPGTQQEVPEKSSPVSKEPESSDSSEDSTSTADRSQNVSRRPSPDSNLTSDGIQNVSRRPSQDSNSTPDGIQNVSSPPSQDFNSTTDRSQIVSSPPPINNIQSASQTTHETKKGPAVVTGICRCCGYKKKCRVINAEYSRLNKLEVYSDMILECFGLMLSHLEGDESERLICGMCIARLRHAVSFRRQVLECEQRLLQANIFVHGDENTLSLNELEKKGIELMDASEDFHDDMLQDEDELETQAEEKEVRKRKRETAAKEITNPNNSNLKRFFSEFKPHSTPEKFIDRGSPKHHNIVTIIENSYVLPFRTSYSAFSCVYCHRTFLEPEKLREHTADHDPTNYKVYQSKQTVCIDVERIDCRLCDEKILDMISFKKHITEVHGKVIYDVRDGFLMFKLKNDVSPCIECGKSFSSFRVLKKHMAEHFGTVMCDKCGSSFYDDATLASHCERIHKNVDKYACEECGKLFRSEQSFAGHKSAVHRKEAFYQCCKCNEVFYSQKERSKHHVEVHRLCKKFTCGLCSKVYNSFKALRVHYRMVHLKIFSHKCIICSKGFALASKLKEHVMSMHKGQSVFQCDICGKSFSKLQYLKMHMHYHNKKD